MRKQLKKIAWLFAFGLFTFAAPLSFGNDRDEDAPIEGGGGGNGHTVCYHKSQVSIGSTYYDCGSCSKIYDERAKGNPSKCF